MSRDVKPAVRAYLEENFFSDKIGSLSDRDSLLQLQILDSTGFLELVSFLESSFGIKVEDDEMIPENLESLENIDAYVLRKVGR